MTSWRTWFTRGSDRRAENGLSRRLRFVDRCVADPPRVHVSVESGQAPDGVWFAPTDLYQFMAERCLPGNQTLETGLGISTVLFAKWGCRHTCVVDKQDEVDRLQEYCRARDIDTGQVTFIVGRSDLVLPTLKFPTLDLFLVDGCHGFPAAVLDWYYGASHLRSGGVLIIDDVPLPSVRLGLLDYVWKDPRWRVLSRGEWWNAFERLSSGSLFEDWSAQTFLGNPAVGT